jgi:beta-galactosidase
VAIGAGEGVSIWGEPETIHAGQKASFSREIVIENPILWSLDNPKVYSAGVAVRTAALTLDSETVPFGIREFHFDPATGFWLNGKNF